VLVESHKACILEYPFPVSSSGQQSASSKARIWGASIKGL